MTTSAYLYAAARTPFGRFGGALAGVRPDDLAAVALTGVLAKAPRLDPAGIGEVVWGNANGAGEDNRNVGRMAVLLAGQQATYFTGEAAPANGATGHVAAWLVLSVVILTVLGTGGGWIYTRNVRRLANDELTRVHRDHAFAPAFSPAWGHA